MANYIPAANIVSNKLLSQSDPRCYVNEKGEKHTKTFLSYNYNNDIDDKLDLNKPLFKLQITKGRIKVDHRGKSKLILHLTDEADIAGLSQLSTGFAYCVAKHKAKFFLRNFDPENPGDLRGAFYYPVNDNGERIAGACPLMDLKIGYETILQIPSISGEYEKIDIKMLLDKEIICSVIIHPSYLLHYGGGPRPVIYVKSCIVLGIIKKVEDEHVMDEDVKQYVQQNPDKLNYMWNLLSKTPIKLQKENEVQFEMVSSVPDNDFDNN